MSVSINQQAINHLTDLSLSAQNVIGLLPGATPLFSRLLQNGKAVMHFPSELAFINDVWVGTQGAESCFVKPLNTWITPTALYYLVADELTGLIRYVENRNASGNKAILDTITKKYGWSTEDTLHHIEQFKSKYGLSSSPLFVSASLEDLARFYRDVIVNPMPEAELEEAIGFAQTHGLHFSAFVDLILFYKHTATLLDEGDSNRLNKLSALLCTIQPEFEKHLTAPVSQFAPDESQLKSIQSQWLAQQPIIGFKDIYAGFRMVSELVPLPADYPDQAIANIAKAISIIEQFFRANSAQDAFPVQTAHSWLYQYKNQEYSGSLQWLTSGTLCLSSFSPLPVNKPMSAPKSGRGQNTRKQNKQPRRNSHGLNQK